MKIENFFTMYKKKQFINFIKVAGSIALIIILGVIFVAMGERFDEKIKAPVKVENIKEYNKAVEEKAPIKIYASEFFDLGCVERSDSNKYDYYIGIWLDEKLVILKLREDQYLNLSNKGPYIFDGNLKKVDFTIKEYIYGFLNEEFEPKEIDSMIAKSYITYERDVTELIAPIICIISLVMCAMLCIMFGILSTIKNAILFRRFKKYLNRESNFEVTMEKIPNEMTSEDVFNKGGYIVTKNYIIIKDIFTLSAFPLKELMWAYVKNGDNRVHLIFSNKYKNNYKVVKFKKSHGENVLNYLAQNNKTSIIGYDARLKYLYDNKKQEFIYNWEIHKSNIENSREYMCMNI